MALKGLKVIEIAGLAPGPFCGMVLAELGATVIKVDRLFGADMDCLANGKQSIAIDLKKPEGAEILRKLCRSSDVLVEPFRKGVMEKLGLGPTELLGDNPRLVYARLTGYGQEGAFAERAGHDINYLAMSGVLSMLGPAGSAPSPPINLAADFGGGGLSCALGILAALVSRGATGAGQVVDSSMTRGAAYLGSWLLRSQSLPIWGQERGANVLDGGAHFYGTYATLDGQHVAVGAIEPQFYAVLLHGLGLEEGDVPQMSDFQIAKKGGCRGVAPRKTLLQEGRRKLAAKFSEKTLAEWCAVFDDVDACVTPVLSPDQASHHRHNQGAFLRCPDGCLAPVPAPALSATPARSLALAASPARGQHTHSVLRELGLSTQEIQRLQGEGVVGTSSSKL